MHRCCSFKEYHASGQIYILWVCRFELLNVTNFCFRKVRYLSENEFIDIAVKENLKRYEPGSRDFNKAYDSLQTFYSQNPHCCKVIYFTPDISAFHKLGVTPLTRLLCFKELIVNVYYEANDYPGQPYYDSFIRMNSCGDVLGAMGILETLPPARPRNARS